MRKLVFCFCLRLYLQIIPAATEKNLPVEQKEKQYLVPHRTCQDYVIRQIEFHTLWIWIEIELPFWTTNWGGADKVQFPFHPKLGIIGDWKSLPLTGHYGHQDTDRLETLHHIGIPLSCNTQCLIFFILNCSNSSIAFQIIADWIC